MMAAFSGNTVAFNRTEYKRQLIEVSNGKVGWACPTYPKDPLPGTSATIEDYCIEPSKTNYDLITDVMNKLGVLALPYVHVLKLAFDTYPSVAMFPIGYQGQEDLSLDLNSPGHIHATGFEAVNVTNVDSFVAQERLTVIDFLSIDTEGFDGKVITGMFRVLGQGFVREFEFEYHQKAAWKHYDLQHLLIMLDMLIYDCFWQGNNGELWRLTGCYHDSFRAKKNWSNVVCVNREEIYLHSKFVNLSKTYM